MPYVMIGELPASVKSVLPEHAQKIYLEAFNHAWEEYKDPKKRKTDSTQEVIAHKVAWAAVKKSYVKKRDVWVTR